MAQELRALAALSESTTSNGLSRFSLFCLLDTNVSHTGFPFSIILGKFAFKTKSSEKETDTLKIKLEVASWLLD